MSTASTHNPKKQCRRDNEPPDIGDLITSGGKDSSSIIPSPDTSAPQPNHPKTFSYKDKLMGNSAIP
ncbi:hypothetical protein V6N12_074478 [Hibiscus sabdariffa]|uniref:Uncharacterized protein n=1 Tax=Hibiscus sabdariffa TaxID=183260 RepID=A0ABR1ZMA0_9ROSI